MHKVPPTSAVAAHHPSHIRYYYAFLFQPGLAKKFEMIFGLAIMAPNDLSFPCSVVHLFSPYFDDR